MNHKLVNIQLLRALAVVCVVLFHGTGFNSINSGRFFNIFQLGAAGVDLFFIISGFIIWHTSSTSHNSFVFLRKRYLRIFPIYWIISFALITAMTLIGQTPDSRHIFYSLLLLPDTNYPILNVGWSLTHELYFYSVFCILLNIRSAEIRMSVLWIWALFSSSCYLYFFPDNPWLQLLTHPFNIEFTLGATLAYMMNRRRKPSYEFWPHCLVASLFTLIYWINEFGWNFPLSIERVIFFALPISLLVLAAVASPEPHGRLSTLISTIGDASYAIYLTHVPVLALINTTANKLSVQLNVAIALGICLIAGWLCYHLLERPLLSKLQPSK